MTFKKILALLLLAVTAIMPLTSCKKEKNPDDDKPGDDFSGSITDGDKEDNKDPEPEIDVGDKDKTYNISTPEEFKNIKRFGTYVLTSDIDMTGIDFTPIGTYDAPFEGTIDGKGHTVKGLKITKCEEDVGISASFKYSYCGFIGVGNKATIKDINFDNAIVDVSTNEAKRTVYSGIIGGFLRECTVSNCKVNGNVHAVSSNLMAYGGGLAGYCSKTIVTNCVSNADIKIEKCPVRAVAGGLIGSTRSDSSVVSSYSTGKIEASTTTGISYSGGLIGYCSTTNITTSYSTSEVFSTVTASSPQTGSKGAAYAGGLVGTVSSENVKKPAAFTRCYTHNKSVTAVGNENSAYAGGISADATVIKFYQCYSNSPLFTSTNAVVVYMGGISGTITEETIIEGCYYNGNISTTFTGKAKTGIGTLAGTSPDIKPDKDGNKKEIIISSAYLASMKININGRECLPSEKDYVIALGTSAQGNIFTSLNLISDILDWDINDWKMIDGNPVPVR